MGCPHPVAGHAYGSLVQKVLMIVTRLRITAAILFSLSCALAAASCAQSPEGALETEANAPAIETNDEGELFGSPDIGIGSSPPPPTIEPPTSSPPIFPGGSESGESDGPEGWFTYNVCVLLERSTSVARSAFCFSQPDCAVRARCRAHVHDSPVSWRNYCYNEFHGE